jgi:hypothetical protein
MAFSKPTVRSQSKILTSYIYLPITRKANTVICMVTIKLDLSLQINEISAHFSASREYLLIVAGASEVIYSLCSKPRTLELENHDAFNAQSSTQ